MKYRYVVERTNDDPFTGEDRYVVSEATPSDPEYRVGSGSYSLDEAKRLAEQSAPESLTWKEPPATWQPDAVAVSQYVDDGAEENRDR